MKLFFLVIFYIISKNVHSVDNDSSKQDSIHYIYSKTTDVRSDTTLTDTILKDTAIIIPLSKDAIEEKVDYSARDSIRFEISNRIVHLYGDAKVFYQDIELYAPYIYIDWNKNTVYAESLKDSLGKIIEIPVFKEKGHEYKSKRISYNFGTQRGLINELVTQEGDGFIHGNRVYKTEDDILYVDHAKYTTCDLDHPHYYIAANRLKIIPQKQIISGPAYLVIEDVPLPLAIPFGFFPSSSKRSSGILIPSYGESGSRGFFFRNGGIYLGLSDYIDLTLLGDIYSKGSWRTAASTDYALRYRFTGTFGLEYAKVKENIETPDALEQTDFFINWSHRQDPKARPYSSFNANVNFGSSQYLRQHSYNTEEILSSNMQSSISFVQSFPGSPFILSTSMMHSQNNNTGLINFSAPNANLSMSRIYPLKSKMTTGRPDWYENIGMSYTMNLRNELIATEEDFYSGEAFDDFRYGIRHNVPVSTNITVLNYFTLSPSLDYTSLWYLDKIEKIWDDENDTVLTFTEQGFFATHEYSARAILSTKLYGFFNIDKIGITTMRHVMTPDLSFNFFPDLTDPDLGYFKTVQTDTSGNFQTYSVFEGGVAGIPNQNRRGVIGFSLANNLEMKIIDKKASQDTTMQTKKIKIFEALNFGSGYDIYKDSNNLENIRFNANTALLDFVNIQFNGTINPYTINEDARLTRHYEWAENKRIGRMTNARLSLNTRLNPRIFESGRKKDEDRGYRYIYGVPYSYAEFDAPWNMSISYSLVYSKPGFEQSLSQTVNFSGEINLTPKWRVNIRSGYNITDGDITLTEINVYRDLHCWEMRFNWIPVGTRQWFMFTINVSSQVLQDLKITRERDYYDF